MSQILKKGGTVDFNCYGVGGCCRCGWRGVPTYRNGKASTYCPACEPFPGVINQYAFTNLPVAPQTGVAATHGNRHLGGRKARVGRNDPCPCGSGKKFKKCCSPSKA